MAVRQTLRVVALFASLLFLAAVFTIPRYSPRLSLIVQRRPFATVVPKESLDIFKFVSTDSFACRAIVFSHGKAIGWIMLSSTGGLPSFIPFSEKPNLEDGITAFPAFGFFPVIAWALRWWLLAIEVVFLVLWLWTRRREMWGSQHSRSLRQPP
jgi:hypothetical protein